MFFKKKCKIMLLIPKNQTGLKKRLKLYLSKAYIGILVVAQDGVSYESFVLTTLVERAYGDVITEERLAF